MAKNLPPIVFAPERSRFFTLPAGVRLVEPDGNSPGVTFPRGFLASGIAAGLKQSGRPDIGVVAVAPQWWATTASAGMFTKNAYAAAPVLVDREQCDLAHFAAVVVNSGNANACTGSQGLEVALAMQSACAEALELPRQQVAVGSTGIIGVPLDAGLLTSAVAKAAAALVPQGGEAFGRSIMTTDRYPKACALEVEAGSCQVRLGACAKGAGMISPALATMICVVTTDAVLEPEQAAGMLSRAVGASFNRITVDGETSTNDSVFFMANGASQVRLDAEGIAAVQEALTVMLRRIALMMVADGEGATKVIKVSVHGAANDEEASQACRAIGNSPLVKTAMYGGDPNWGRILSSAGAALSGYSFPETCLHLCGVKVVQDSAAAPLSEADEAALRAGMKAPELEIDLDLRAGRGESELFFSDLGHEYVTINSEYHS